MTKPNPVLQESEILAKFDRLQTRLEGLNAEFSEEEIAADIVAARSEIAHVPYQPQTVTAPGETLADLLTEQQTTPAELAERMGCQLTVISRIIEGKVEITPDLAVKLSQVFGVSAAYWLKHEEDYRSHLVERRV